MHKFIFGINTLSFSQVISQISIGFYFYWIFQFKGAYKQSLIMGDTSSKNRGVVIKKGDY